MTCPKRSLRSRRLLHRPLGRTRCGSRISIAQIRMKSVSSSLASLVRGANQIMDDIDPLSINAIRTFSIDAIQKANSGHPATPMGMAPVAYTIWHGEIGRTRQMQRLRKGRRRRPRPFCEYEPPKEVPTKFTRVLFAFGMMVSLSGIALADSRLPGCGMKPRPPPAKKQRG